MFRPLQTDQGRDDKARAYFMLAAGGRVVRSHHHPDASNSNKRLMVPTEKELKTILYDQTGARVMAHNRRENIDYVALNADRRPRRATRMGEGFDREDRQVAGRATTESPCRERAPTNPYRRLAPNPSKGTCVEHHRLVGTGDNSPKQKMDVDDLHPCPRSAEEDAPVSVFLDSFSAFGMATADAVQPMEVTPDSQPTRQEHAPDKPTHRAEATASTEAAYELSEPLAQVDVYSILSKAPPAEIRNGMSRAEAAGNPKLPTRGKNKRVRGPVHRAENAGSGEQRLTEAEPTLKIAYLARDPLGDEVAELDAKLQEKARRLRQKAAKQQPPPRATNIARQAALLIEKMQQPPNADRPASCGNANANPTLRTTKSDGTATTQGLGRHGDGAVQPDRRRKQNGFVSTTNNPTALPHRAGRRRGWVGSPDVGGFTTRQTCRGKPMELSLENGRKNVELEEDAPGMGAGGVFEARIGFGDFSSVQRVAGKTVPETEGRKVVGSKPRRRKGPEHNDTGEVQLHKGESSFQPGGRTEIGIEPLAATLVAASDNGVSNKEHLSHSNDSGSIEAGDSRGCSCSGGSAAGVLAEDAAALRIESCWRGFLGRCAAKRELRSIFLDALRKIGGGRISKAMALGDVAEGDRRQLNHALRTATQSRRPLRQLPAQAQILECARFVAAFQRRHAKAVDARKKRWVAEREKRKGIERARARARCGLLKPVPTAKTRLLRSVQA